MAAQPTIDGNPMLALGWNVDYRDVVEALFVRTALDDSLTTFCGSNWVTRSCVHALPRERLAQVDRSARATEELLVRLEGSLVHAILSERSVTVRVAAQNADDAAATQRLVEQALPEVTDADAEVPVRFWWWQQGGSRDLARMLPASS
jgi:hypothetical protein